MGNRVASDKNLQCPRNLAGEDKTWTVTKLYSWRQKDGLEVFGMPGSPRHADNLTKTDGDHLKGNLRQEIRNVEWIYLFTHQCIDEGTLTDIRLTDAANR